MAKIFVNKLLPYEGFKLEVKRSFYPYSRGKSFKAFKVLPKANYAPRNYEQRSIAKVSYVKNSYSKQWAVQGRYLARQGAQLDGRPAYGFNAEDEELNLSQTLNNWQEKGDLRMWKVIISPEMAHKLDLKEHVVAVMSHVQKDLGVGMEWVAVGHYNTDNPHVHVVIRGVDKEGKELRMPKEYFTQGFRLRSAQEATRVLGYRLEQDVLLRRELGIKSFHITELDREIERRLTQDRFINLKADTSNAFVYERELQLKSRLMFLEEKGLAKVDSSVSWYVQPGFIDYLKYVQTQHDLIKTKNKHIHNISNPNLPVVKDNLENIGDKLVGKIIGMDFDEFHYEARYMLIEGVDNKIHYVPASIGMSQKRDNGELRNGEIIYLERKELGLFAQSFGSYEEFNYSKQLKPKGLGLSLNREDSK